MMNLKKYHASYKSSNHLQGELYHLQETQLKRQEIRKLRFQINHYKQNSRKRKGFWANERHFNASEYGGFNKICLAKEYSNSVRSNTDWYYGYKSLALLHWGSKWFGNKKGERMKTYVCALSFHHAETPWASIPSNREPPLPIIPVGIVACAFVGQMQPFWKQLYMKDRIVNFGERDEDMIGHCSYTHIL